MYTNIERISCIWWPCKTDRSPAHVHGLDTVWCKHLDFPYTAPGCPGREESEMEKSSFSGGLSGMPVCVPKLPARFMLQFYNVLKVSSSSVFYIQHGPSCVYNCG